MSPIEIVYKTVYNYFVKRDGYSENSYVLAGAFTFLFNFLFLLNCYIIVNLIINHSMSISVGKIFGLMIIGVLMMLNHWLLFGILKFSKNGDRANKLFNLNRETYVFGWRIFALNLFVFIIVPILGALFLK